MRMTEQECRRRFAAARVARLATVTTAGRPHIVPVTFAIDGDVIYTAVDAKPKTTTDLQRIRNLRVNPAAAMLADHYDSDWSALWWVRADGQAAVLEGPVLEGPVLDAQGLDQPGATTEPLRLLARRYAQYQLSPPGGPVIMITVRRWTGWRASPA